MNANELRRRFRDMMARVTDDEIVADFVSMGYVEIDPSESNVSVIDNVVTANLKTPTSWFSSQCTVKFTYPRHFAAGVSLHSENLRISVKEIAPVGRFSPSLELSKAVDSDELALAA